MDKFDHVFINPKDFDKSLHFYRDVLGWKVVSSWGEIGEERGAVLKSEGGFSVVIAEQHDSQDNAAKGKSEHKPTVHLNTENVDERFKQLSNGGQVVVKPENTHWGTRWFVVKDPDGNLLAFNSPRK